jgi:signal transduction histidine kinase
MTIPAKLKSILFYGTGGMQKHDIRRLICMGVNAFSLLIIAINGTIGILSCIIVGKMILLAGVVVEIMLAPIPLLLNYHKKRTAASICFFLIINFAVFFFSCVLGRLVEIQSMIIFLIGLSVFMFLDIKAQMTGIAISLVNILLVEYNFDTEFIPHIQTTAEITLYLKVASYGVMVMLVIQLFWFYRKGALLLFDKLQDHTQVVERDLENKEQENKMKDRFIGNAWHETKSSYYTISAMINLLEKTRTKTELQTVTDNLKAAFEISTTFVDNILEYVKNNQAGNLKRMNNELVDMRKLLTNITDIYKYAADENEIRMTSLVSQEFPEWMLIDKEMISKVITNLVSNAIKYAGPETKVHIHVGLKPGDYWTLSVDDDGAGIPDDLRARIFEPFVTTNPRGTGLGLYIVKQLVSSMDGDLSVESIPGRGSRFTVLMPVNAY